MNLFNRKPSPQLSIIDIARNKMIAERDQHEAAMRHYENIAREATANMEHHEAAYLAYDAILKRIEPREHVLEIPEFETFSDAEFEAALTLTDTAGVARMEEIGAKIARTRKKDKTLPKATGAAAAC